MTTRSAVPGARCSGSTRINHTPISPVREDVVGEVVMMEQWSGLVDRLVLRDLDESELVSPLAHILSVPLDQRAASVAASFMRWLGTNNGRGYLHAGSELLAKHGSNAYLVAWVLENRRFQGARTIEHVLAPPGSYVPAGAFFERKLARKIDINDTDCEVVENIAEWLGSEEGQCFLAESERLICARVVEQRAADQAQRLQRMHAAGGFAK